ncbi:MAG: SHOCT domain-containing protein [Chloroflexi bacterium]|nr:SHOCT domain-containing protein [Chloroflexota bacterium]
MQQTNRTVSILTVVAAALILVVLLGGLGMMWFWPVGSMGPGMMWAYGPASAAWGGWGGAMMAPGVLAMVVFLGAAVVVVVLVARWLLPHVVTPSVARGDGALAILKRRYAADEITQEQYEQMRRTITR